MQSRISKPALQPNLWRSTDERFISSNAFMSFSRRSDKYPLSCQRFGIASVYVAERQNRLVIDRLPCKIFFTKVNNKFVASTLCPCPSRRAAINKRIEIVLVLRAPCSSYRGYISLFSVLLHMTEAARQFRGLLL